MVALIVSACGNFPKDPNHSFKTARATGLRVGVVNNPPWAYLHDGIAAGSEAEIIKAFAEKHDMQVEWVAGPEHALILGLEESELHVVIGGITEDSPFKDVVGLTNPYRKEDIIICGLAGSADIKDRKVGVREGTGVGAYVKKKGGVPVYVDSLLHFPGPIAASTIDHEQARLKGCSKPIQTLHHVMAVAKGENELLLKLEEHINETGRQ